MADEEGKAKAPDADAKTKDELQESFNRDYVEGLRGEAADWRTKLRDSEKSVENLADKLKKFEDAQKSELERVTEEKASLEQKLANQERAMIESGIATAIRLEAVNAGVANTEDVIALIDREGVEYNDGEVVGVAKALKKLLKDKPYLVKGEEKPVPPTPGVGGKPIDGSDANPIDEAFLGLLKSAQPEEF